MEEQLADAIAAWRRHWTFGTRHANTAQNYRYWVIWRCPSVRFLDFTKIRDVERKKAQELFGTADEPTELAKEVRTSSHTWDKNMDANLARSRATSQRASPVSYTHL